jgi:hypothetical protein
MVRASTTFSRAIWVCVPGSDEFKQAISIRAAALFKVYNGYVLLIQPDILKRLGFQIEKSPWATVQLPILHRDIMGWTSVGKVEHRSDDQPGQKWYAFKFVIKDIAKFPRDMDNILMTMTYMTTEKFPRDHAALFHKAETAGFKYRPKKKVILRKPDKMQSLVMEHLRSLTVPSDLSYHAAL